MIGLNIAMPIPERCVDCTLYNVRTMCCHILNQWCVGIERLPNCPLVKDVAPVRHARWEIDEADGEYHCTNCRAILEKYMYEGNNFYRCYHCGAVMDGGSYNCGAKMEAEDSKK